MNSITTITWHNMTSTAVTYVFKIMTIQSCIHTQHEAGNVGWKTKHWDAETADCKGEEGWRKCRGKSAWEQPSASNQKHSFASVTVKKKKIDKGRVILRPGYFLVLTGLTSIRTMVSQSTRQKETHFPTSKHVVRCHKPGQTGQIYNLFCFIYWMCYGSTYMYEQ